MPDPYRTLDLSSFTTDAWATQAGYDLPPEELWMACTDSTVRISLRPRDGLTPEAETVADEDTAADVRVVKIMKDERGVDYPVFLESVEEATTNKISLGREVVETDLAQGMRIAIGFPAVTTGAGSADACAVYVEGALLLTEF